MILNLKYNDYQEKHNKLIDALKLYLNSKGFRYYFEDSIPIGAPRRPDIIGNENDERVFYEVIVGKHIDFYRVLNRLNQFIQEGAYKRGYLVISNDVDIPKRAQELYEAQGFGIIKLDPTKKTPEPEKILDSDDHTKKSKEFIEYSKDWSEWAGKHPRSLSYLKEILIFIICGELLVNGIWELASTKNLGYLWVIIPTGLILILAFCYLYKKENRNN